VAGLAVLVVLLPLANAPLASASVPTCDASTVAVTPVQSPDGTQRPMYVDLAHGATQGSGYVGYELSGASGILGSDVWIQLSGFGGVVGLAANQSAAIPVRATSQAGHPLVYGYLTATGTSATAQSWTVEVWNGKPGQIGSSEVCTQGDGFSEVDNVISANANKITSISVSTTQPAIGGTFQVTAVGDTGTMGAGPSSDQSGGNGVFSMAPSMDNGWPADTFTLTGVQVTIGGATLHDKLRVYPGTAAAGAYTAVYSFTVRGSAASSTNIVPVQNIASGTQVKYTGSYPATTAIPVPVQTASLVKSASNFSSGDLTYQVVVSNSSTDPVTLDYVQDTPTPTSGWTFKTGSAKLGAATISDPINSSGVLIFGGPFTVPAAAGSTAGTITFTYTLHLTATVTNSVVGSVGGQTLAAPSGTQNEVTVDPSAPIVTTGSLPDAVTGTAYSQLLSVSSGTAPYTWTVTAGSLPAGLSLTASTGRISGTPTGTGTSTFTVTVTDSQGTPKSGSKSLSITVGNPVLTDTTAPTGSVTIDSGATATSSTIASIALAATDAVGVTAYRAAEGSDCSAASWTAVTSTTSYSATTSLTLSAGDGTKTVCVQYKDAAGNASTTATATITLDTAAPTVALTSSSSNPTNAAFTVTATFSEPVTGFSLAGVSVGNGAKSALSGSGTTYMFTVTPTSNGSVTVDLAAGSASDAAGNANTAAPQLTRTYDATPPSVTLSSGASNPTNAAFIVTATFSEPVSGFSLAGVSVGNGATSNLSGSGATYTFTVTPAADGAVTVDLAAASASDAAGNPNTAASQLTRTYDATRPSAALSSSSSNPTNTAFTVTATFTEPVTGFSLADVSVGNGAKSSLSGSGTTYTFTVSPAADGAVTVDIPAGGASDTAGNTNAAATPLTRTYDTTRPSVALSSSSANPTNAAFTVTATFSEPVSGFSLAGVTVGNGTKSNLSGSGATYTFTVTPSADGTVTVDLAAASASDAAGNTNTAASQLSRDYDATRPSAVLSSSSSNPTNAAFPVTAVFSEPVTGFSLAAVSVGNGTASNLSGSGATYTFTVAPSADGAVTVDVPGGGASDTAGNTNAAASQLSRSYDATRPSAALSSSSSNPTDAPFTVTATFSELVMGFSLADVAVGNGAASALSGSGATYTFTVTPSVDGAVTVDVAGGSAADAAGNTNTAASRLSRTYDATRPSVTLSSSAPDPTNAPFTVVATFSEPVTGFTLAGVQVGNGLATDLSGLDTTYSFTVTPSGDGTVTVDLAAGSASDAAGNTNTSATHLTRAYDTARPSVALSTLAPDPTNTTISVIVVFSKSVTGFSAADVVVRNGTTSAFSGSGAVYGFTVTPTGDGTVTIDVPAGGAADSVGNTNTAATRLARTYDATRPGVALSTPAANPTNAASFAVRATFTEPVTGFGLAGVSVDNGTASNLQGSGAAYTFTVTPAGDGIVTVELAAGSASDGSGNTNTAARPLAITSDRTPPRIAFSATSASLAFTADDPSAALACSIDGGPFVDCTSPVSLSGLAAGDHIFEVQATDEVGNSSTASRSWTVATQAFGKSGPDVKVEIKASSDDVVAGRQFRTTVTATNVGSATAEDVTLKIDLPPNTEFVSGEAFRSGDQPEAWLKLSARTFRTLAAAGGFPCSVNGSVVYCPVGRLDPAAQFIVNLDLRTLHAGMLELQANTSASNADSANAALRLNARPPKVEITVELKTKRSFDEVRKGDVFGATGIVTNVGGSVAEDVRVRLLLPAKATLVSELTHRCTLQQRAVRCAIGTLAPKARFVIALRLRALRDGRIAVLAIGSTRNQRNVRSHLVLHAPGGKACTIYGTARIVRGTPGDDVICLSPAFHIVYALAGNDIVYGRGGIQVEYGGRGKDVLFGGAGNDYLDGGRGRDILRGGPGNDKLLGRAGNDVLSGGRGHNRLHGGAGRDRELWHRGDVVFEVARGPVREWRKQWLSRDVPLITHLLTHV